MSDWVETTLGEIADINPLERLAKGTNAPKITMNALQPFTKKISGFLHEEYKGGTKFRNGDTLVARITPCLENGKTAYVDILKDGELAFGSTEFIILREKEKKSDKSFLYYFSTSPDFRDVAILAMTGSSGRQRVQTNAIASHLFVFPPLPKQKAIAGVLSCLDDKIDLLHRQNKTLESLAKTLFHQWFIKDTDSNKKGILSDYVDSANTGLDAIRRAPIVEYETDIRCIRIQDVSQNKKYDNWGFSEVEEKNYAKFKLTKGDIIMARTCSPGINYFVRENINAVFNNGLVRIRTNKAKVYPVLLYYLFKTRSFIGHIDAISGGTSVQLNMQIGDLLAYEIYFPPIEEQDKIIDAFHNLDNKVLHNQKQIKTLESLRDTLLPKLMSGAVRVEIEEVV